MAKQRVNRTKRARERAESGEERVLRVMEEAARKHMTPAQNDKVRFTSEPPEWMRDKLDIPEGQVGLYVEMFDEHTPDFQLEQVFVDVGLDVNRTERMTLLSVFNTMMTAARDAFGDDNALVAHAMSQVFNTFCAFCGRVDAEHPILKEMGFRAEHIVDEFRPLTLSQAHRIFETLERVWLMCKDETEFPPFIEIVYHRGEAAENRIREIQNGGGDPATFQTIVTDEDAVYASAAAG